MVQGELNLGQKSGSSILGYAGGFGFLGALACLQPFRKRQVSGLTGIFVVRFCCGEKLYHQASIDMPSMLLKCLSLVTKMS